jgi:3-methyladenine DNA glycosylase AlkD
MYEYILDKLNSLADTEYRQFHSKLLPNVDIELIGVRIPQLRKIAREIIKSDWRVFLTEYKKSNLYEFVMLCGMVTAGAKCDFEEKLGYVTAFVPRINNWAVCDTFCGDLKQVEQRLDVMYSFLQPYLTSDKEYELRFGVVILMQYYINDEYIDKVLAWYGKIRHDGYYVKMAVAWGLSVCFVKYREKTLEFLEHCDLDTFTYNKTIQKIRESYRVSNEDKEMLKGMKR